MNTKNMSYPTVSVIVPIYNREKYIARCIESILRQTYKDFELILVDDGSKDGSLVICEEYARKDGRIVVLHKENGGVSSARNLGLDNARGEWICFVDSDDYVTEHYIQSLTDLIGKYGSEPTLYVSGIMFIGKRAGQMYYKKPYQIMYNSLYIIDEKLKIERVTTGTDVSKLYNREIIKQHNIKFPEGLIYSEDQVFIYRYLLYVSRIATVSEYDYIYEFSESSVSKKIYTYDEALQPFYVTLSSRRELFNKYNINDENLFWLDNAVEWNLRRLINGCLMFPLKDAYKKTKEIFEIEGIKTIANTKAQGLRKQISRLLLKRGMFWPYVIFSKIMILIGKRVEI